VQIGHRFETFLVTLFREVQKRAVLQGLAPADDPLDGDTAPIPAPA
jgi:hypothetical protein